MRISRWRYHAIIYWLEIAGLCANFGVKAMVGRSESCSPKVNHMGTLLTLSIRLLEFLFVIGILGSAAVIAVTTIEDVEVILDKDEAPNAPED